MKTFFVSIVIPVYNGEKYIKECIDSLICQTYTDFEIIIVDDGSTDMTEKICHQYHKMNSVLYYKIEHGGVSKARNVGIKCSRGQYIVFVDSDDRVTSRYLSSLVELISLNEVEMGIVGYSVAGRNMVFNGSQKRNGIYNKNEILSLYYKRDSFRGYLFNKIFNLQIIKQNSIWFKNDISMCEDALFFFSYLRYTERVAFKNESNYLYYINPEGLSHCYDYAKRISVLNAYKEICEIISEFCNATIKSKFELALIDHMVHLYYNFKDNRDFIIDYYPSIILFLKRHIFEVIFSSLPIKTKVLFFYTFIN